MLRDVDERFMSRVSSLSQVPFSFGRINDLTDPLWKEAARSAAKSNAPVAQALDGVREAQYSLLYDYFGEPAFLLRITHEREISLYGRKAMRVLLVLTVVLGLLFGMLNYLLVRRYVVRRVQRLIRFASGVNLEQGLAERINISGKDEIAQLGATLNQMLDQLQLSRDELVATGERLQFEATHDALTGAWNRSAGFEMLDREIDRCSRERTQVAVIMLDLDHFKSVNDQYGHSAGDAVLKTFTAIVSRDLRSFDVLARFGGEEFFIVAPNCSLKEAQGIAHRILHRLRAVPIHVNDTTVHVSASAGVTAGAAPFTSEDMIAVADRAMYRAKEKGRNCVQSEALDPNRSVRAHLFAVQ